MTHADLLIEIGCEELPARFVLPLAQSLADGLGAGLQARGIEFGDTQLFATPRRVAALLRAVSRQQPDQATERRGPALAAAFRDGQPTKAAEGFARGCGVPVEALETIETDKGAYLNFRKLEPGRATAALLQEILDETLKRMDEIVPKRMRWGAGDATFVRPVHSLIALHGDTLIPLMAFGLQANRIGHGHRFHAPTPFTLAHANEYAATLEQASVIADFAERRERIRDQVETVSGGRALISAALLDEVTALVEWPEPILGQFDEAFLELPEEVIVTTIQDHQRYFPVYTPEGKISRQFVTVANISSSDPAAVVAGNEKVVRPRLQDALFFWQQDLRADFSAWRDKLEKVTYIKGLGSIADKSRRMQQLARVLAPNFALDPDITATAAGLAKLDLASHAVFEMPELQGVMGGYYARHKGFDDQTCQAIAEHYLPLGPEDALPGQPLAAVVALSDKLDSLICLFSQENLRPTSSKDPYGARRAALGVIRILAGFERNLSLGEVLIQAAAEPGMFASDDSARDTLLKFFQDRLRVWLLAQGVDPRIAEAVLNRDQRLNVHDVVLRCAALGQIQDSPAFAQLAAANKRIRNILGAAQQPALRAQVLAEAEEKTLWHALQEGEPAFRQALQQQDYVAGVQTLAALSDPITAFFDQVLVNADDPELRQARHALLGIFEQRCTELADFAALSHG